MEITKEWLKKENACSGGLDWFNFQHETDGIKIIKKLMQEESEYDALDWANWLIVRIMNYTQRGRYLIFAAEQVLPIFEKRYPDNSIPREAIEAAKKCIENPTQKNKEIAAATATAAAAYAAAYAAAAAYSSSSSSASSAYSAAAAFEAVKKKEMKIKILNYGIELLEKK